MLLMVNSSQFFQGIQKESCRCTEKIGSFSTYDSAVRKFHCCSRAIGFFLFFEGSRYNLSVCDLCVSLLKEQFDLAYFILCTGTGNQSVHALVIAADDLLTGSFLAYFIINDTVACHVNTHICRRFVRAAAHDLLKHSLYNRENLYITVIVNSSLAVSFQMERIDHVDIIQICSSSFISKVYRMFQREVPDREGLEFCIAGFYATFIFMIELRKAGCHLSASRSWCCDDNERSGSFDIIILSVAFITYNKGGIAWISRDQVKLVNTDSQLLQTFLEEIGTFLAGVLRDAYTSYIQATACKLIHKTEHVFVIGNAKVAAHFILVNVIGTDNNNDLRLIRKLHQHAEFAVRFKTRKNTGCMVVVKQFAAEFKIKFVAELTDPFTDMF